MMNDDGQLQVPDFFFFFLTKAGLLEVLGRIYRYDIFLCVYVCLLLFLSMVTSEPL